MHVLVSEVLLYATAFTFQSFWNVYSLYSSVFGIDTAFTVLFGIYKAFTFQSFGNTYSLYSSEFLKHIQPLQFRVFRIQSRGFNQRDSLF